MSELSHVSESGEVRMVDVGGKPLSRRRAVASAQVRMAAETARRLRELPKGDALVTAQLAGIMAAKRTAELIPLCHPLPLTSIDVQVVAGDVSVEITATVETTAQTGVEMEALTAAAVAALTVYDMAKAVDKGMVVDDVKLVREDEVVIAAVLTISDGVARASAKTPAATRSRSCSRGRATTSCGAWSRRARADLGRDPRSRRRGAARPHDGRDRRGAARRDTRGDARRDRP